MKQADEERNEEGIILTTSHFGSDPVIHFLPLNCSGDRTKVLK